MTEQIAAYLKVRKSFTRGNLRAERNGPLRQGKLDAEAYKRLAHDEPTYIVYSYETPIAWITPDGVPHLPEVAEISKTTRQHQDLVKEHLR